jgi:zinc/manganese transport system ATP-binding protein
LKSIAGIVRPSTGKITLDPSLDSCCLAYLPQSTTIQKDFPISVAQVVATGLWPTLGERGALNDNHQKRISAALAEVGMTGFEDRQIGNLSGGEFQRMLFARIILQDARLILLDEPFTSVDAETTARLIQLLLRWHEQGRAIICVLHDLMLIQKYFPESFVLAGKCLGKGHTHKLFEQKLLSFDLDMAELCAGEGETHAKHEHPHDMDDGDHTMPGPGRGCAHGHTHGPGCDHDHS